MTPADLKASAATIAIVMMENRSFDHVLGHLRADRFGGWKELDGVEDVTLPDYANPDSRGKPIYPFFAPDRKFISDLPHGTSDVATQLAQSPAKQFQMTGFVKAHERKYQTTVDHSPPMMLLDPSGAPVTSELARRYTVCDRWFASLPTYTAPNRLMALSGYYTPKKGKLLLPAQDTVYEWLSRHGVRWRVYSAGFPFVTLMLKSFPMLLGSHFRRLHELPLDLANEAADERPEVIFIEPEYYDTPIHLHAPCDNHPPLSMAAGEAFLAKVYGYLSADAQLWSRLVMILSYDEHGGFWDHVPPPKIPYHGEESFESTGPRVPAVLVGPFAAQRVCKTTLDNTAILQLLADRFGKPQEAYSSKVLERTKAGIGSITAELSLSSDNRVYPLPAPVQSAEAGAPNQESLIYRGYRDSLALLLTRHRSEALLKYPELRALLDKP